MQLHPYGTKLVVKPAEGGDLRSAGFIVPDTVAASVPPQQGTVLLVGPRVTRVARGQRVVYGLGVGQELVLDNEPLVFIDERDVICGIE